MFVMKIIPKCQVYDDQDEYLADIEHINDEDVYVESTTLDDCLRFKTRKDCYRFIHENGLDEIVSVHALEDRLKKT